MKRLVGGYKLSEGEGFSIYTRGDEAGEKFAETILGKFIGGGNDEGRQCLDNGATGNAFRDTVKEGYLWKVISVDSYSAVTANNEVWWVNSVGTVSCMTMVEVPETVKGDNFLGTVSSYDRNKHPGLTSIEGDVCYVYDGVR